MSKKKLKNLPDDQLNVEDKDHEGKVKMNQLQDESKLVEEADVSKVHMKTDSLKAKSIHSKKVNSLSNYESELCVFCYESRPNILIDPCCHGGICKQCMIKYLKNNGDKCPFGKETI